MERARTDAGAGGRAGRVRVVLGVVLCARMAAPPGLTSSYVRTTMAARAQRQLGHHKQRPIRLAGMGGVFGPGTGA